MLFERVARALHALEDVSRVREKRLARLREHHSARRALEERRTELVFEPPNLSADRGLRDAELARGAADVASLRDGDEVFDLSEAHADESTSP